MDESMIPKSKMFRKGCFCFTVIRIHIINSKLHKLTGNFGSKFDKIVTPLFPHEMSIRKQLSEDHALIKNKDAENRIFSWDKHRSNFNANFS